MQPVTVKRIRVNFQVRFGYNPELTEYIKKLPKDQIQTKMEPINSNGKTVEDWFRVCNIAGLSKVLWYCWDNNVPIKYDAVKESDITRIEEFARNKQKAWKESLRLKNEDFDGAENDEYPFMKIQPYGYQKQDVRFFETVNGISLLGSAPGIGKTMSAIAYATKNKYKTLVICPASLKLNWRKEILKFTHETPYIFKYKPLKREKTINYSSDDSLFHIINYESLETYLKFEVHHKCQNPLCGWEETSHTKKHKSCPKCFKEKSVKSRNSDICNFSDKSGVEMNINDYDLVVLDECHLIKETKTHRTKIVKTAFKNIKKKLLLSGTAIKNRPYEFFSILNFLDEHEWVNAHSFGVRYCDGKQDKFDHWNYDGNSNLDELFQRISYLYLRRRKKDVLKYLPPKTYTNIPVELTPEERREYTKIEKEVINQTNESDDRMTHLARIQLLKQFTSRINASRSFDFIQNIIDGEEKIVVFTQYLHTATMVYEHFKDCGVIFTGKQNMTEKNEAVEKFMNDPDCKVFVGSIGAAGVGITLTSASIVLFLDRPWEPGGEEQCEDRCISEGQLIMTKEGFKKIENVKINDYVYSSLGNWQKVIDVWSNSSNNRYFVEIKYTGFSYPLITTDNHRIYVYDIIENKYKYVEAKNIDSTNHKLVFSAPQKHTDIIKTINVELVYGDKFLNLNNKLTVNGRVKNPCIKLKLSNELMYAFGWYLAEGWSCVAQSREKGSHVSICGNLTTESENVKAVAEIFIDKFKLTNSKISYYTKKSSNCLSAYIYSKNLANFFINHFGQTSKNKKIPDFVFKSSENHIKSFLRGYYDGDGYERGNSQQASTKSDLIAIGLCQLESLLSKPIRLNRTVWDGWSFEYTIPSKSKRKMLIQVSDNKILFPINQVKKYSSICDTKVYDITVENDESFTVGLASVHNCHRANQTANKVEIIKLICQGTIDEDIDLLLESKKEVVSKVLDGEYVADRKTFSIFNDLVKIILNKKLSN